MALATVAVATLTGCGDDGASGVGSGDADRAAGGTAARAGSSETGGSAGGSAGSHAITASAPNAGTPATGNPSTAGSGGAAGTVGGSGGTTGDSGGTPTAGAGGTTGDGGGTTAGAGGTTGGHRFVFVETPEITHDRDYFPFQYGDPSYVPEDVPTNWLSPVDYSQGTMHMTLDVLDAPEGTSAEFYYTVTFTQTGADYDEGWVRPAIHVVPGQTHYEDAWPVGDTQFVWNDGTEHTATAAERWDFSRPFDHVAGDLVAWPNASFPIRVKVRIELSVP